MTDRSPDIDALLADLRTARRARSGTERSTAPPHTAAEAKDPFAALPETDAINFQLGALRKLGLSSPYHGLCDGAPGAEMRYDGQPAVSFSSYDYLGLNGHPAVAEAAVRAIAENGVSAMASRLCGGERPVHRHLEGKLAGHYNAEAALAFVSGHATNVSTLFALCGSDDLILHDALCHNSIVEGARRSGGTRLVMPHNDLDWLEDCLSARRRDYRRALIVVEGLYSMDGDAPDLARLVEIKARHGAWLMVDEAHALGTLGATGRGIAEQQGVEPGCVEVWMGTLSKTLASCGGYICGSRSLVDILKATAPGFVYSVALAPPLAAAATAALGCMEREVERVHRCRQNGQQFLEAARASGLNTGLAQGHAIVPIVVGDSLRAVRASRKLLELGVSAMPIVHPAVPERSARLRFFLTSCHSPAQIDLAVAKTVRVLSEA